MKELIQRFKAETPVFFRKVRNMALIIAGICGSISVAYGQLPDGMASTIPTSVIKCIAVASLTAAAVAQATKND